MTDLTNVPEHELDATIEATLYDIPSSSTATGVTISALPSLSGLSPEMQERIHSNRAANPRMSLEDAIRDELRTNQKDHQLLIGISDKANALQKEAFAVACEARDIQRGIEGLKERLAEVRSFDSETGEPILRLTGDVRRDVEMQLRAEEHRYHLRTTTEMKARLDKAKEQTKADILAAKETREDAAEIKRRVAEAARENRISQVVEAKVRMQRNTF